MIRQAKGSDKIAIDPTTLIAYHPSQLKVEQQDGEGGWREVSHVSEVDCDAGYAVIPHRYGTTWTEERVIGNFRIVTP